MKNAFAFGMVCALGLAACLASGCKDDPPPGNHIDTSGHDFSIDGPCDPDTLVGSFEVASRESGTFQYAVVSGSITNGVNWNNTALFHEESGACKLYEFSMWSCSPACQGGQICNNEETCIAFPANLDMGTVEVVGLVTDVSMEPDTSFNYQFDVNDDATFTNPPFTPGVQIFLWAEGGAETEEMLFDGMGVTPLTVESKDYTMHEDENMVVTWNPSDDTEGEIYGQFSIDQHGASKMWIHCTWEDAAGSGTVPANLVNELYADWTATPIPGFATAYLFRRTVDSVAVSQGCTEFRVVSQIQLNLDYVPPDSWDGGVDDDAGTDWAN